MPVPLYLGERGTPGRRRIGEAVVRDDGTLDAIVTDRDVIERMHLGDRSFSIRAPHTHLDVKPTDPTLAESRRRLELLLQHRIDTGGRIEFPDADVRVLLAALDEATGVAPFRPCDKDPDVDAAACQGTECLRNRVADPFADATRVRSREDLPPHLVEALDRRSDQCRTWGLAPTWRDEVQFVEGWRAVAALPEAREVVSLLNAHADGRPEATDATIRAAVSDLLHAIGVEA